MKQKIWIWILIGITQQPLLASEQLEQTALKHQSALSVDEGMYAPVTPCKYRSGLEALRKNNQGSSVVSEECFQKSQIPIMRQADTEDVETNTSNALNWGHQRNQSVPRNDRESCCWKLFCYLCSNWELPVS